MDTELLPNRMHDEITLALASDDEAYRYLAATGDWVKHIPARHLALLLCRRRVRDKVAVMPFYVNQLEAARVRQACRRCQLVASLVDKGGGEVVLEGFVEKRRTKC